MKLFALAFTVGLSLAWAITGSTFLRTSALAATNTVSKGTAKLRAQTSARPHRHHALSPRIETRTPKNMLV